MLPIIISAPHACSEIKDKEIRKRIALTDEQIWRMSDPFTDRLEFFKNAAVKHIAPTHRILGDLNRAPNESAFREKDFWGNQIFHEGAELDESEKQQILKENWFSYHNAIIESIHKLEDEGEEEILLIDFHNTSGDHPLNKRHDYMPAIVLSNLGGLKERHPFLSIPNKNLNEFKEEIRKSLEVEVETNHVFHGGYELTWFSHLHDKLFSKAKLYAVQLEYNLDFLLNPITHELNEKALGELYAGLNKAVENVYESL